MEEGRGEIDERRWMKSRCVLSSLIHANALVILPAVTHAVRRGGQVDVWLVGEGSGRLGEGEILRVD